MVRICTTIEKMLNLFLDPGNEGKRERERGGNPTEER